MEKIIKLSQIKESLKSIVGDEIPTHTLNLNTGNLDIVLTPRKEIKVGKNNITGITEVIETRSFFTVELKNGIILAID